MLFIKNNNQNNSLLSLSHGSSTLSKLKKQASRDGNMNNQKSDIPGNSIFYVHREAEKNDKQQQKLRSSPDLSNNISNQLPLNSDTNESKPNIIELNEPLTSQRPLRPASRPTSGSFLRATTPNRSLSQSSVSSICENRISELPDSEDATDCISFEMPKINEKESDKPPPLPVKQSSVDYTNLILNDLSNDSIDWTLANTDTSKRSSLNTPSSGNQIAVPFKTYLKNKPPPPLPPSSPQTLRVLRSVSAPSGDEDIPPELPLKKPLKSNQMQKIIATEDNDNSVNTSNNAECID